MNANKFAAVLLIVAGILALGYGGFTYTKDSHRMDVGSLHMSVDEKQHVSIPVWAGIGALLIGGVLLSLRRKV
jgi:LPXTG-motif cell wall-anchored protein